MNGMSQQLRRLCSVAPFMGMVAGPAAAQTVYDREGANEKTIPNEIRASEEARDSKAAAEDTFEARLDAVDQDISDLREQVEGLAPNGEMIDTALAGAALKRAAAERALDDYKRADVSDWTVFRMRANQAFAQMNAALDQARNEVLAH